MNMFKTVGENHRAINTTRIVNLCRKLFQEKLRIESSISDEFCSKTPGRKHPFDSFRRLGQGALLAAVLCIPNIPAQPPQKIDVAYIEVGRRGFIPQHLTHPAGKIIMSVHNLTKYKLDLTLQRETGSALKTVTLYDSTGRWKEAVDYTPGEYLLKDANHPDWICRISIGK